MVNIFRPSTWLPARRESAAGDADRVESIDQGDVMEMAQPVARTAPRIQKPVQERIEERAYRKWLDAGCPGGQDVQFWLEAEQEVLEEIHQDKHHNG